MIFMRINLVNLKQTHRNSPKFSGKSFSTESKRIFSGGGSVGSEIEALLPKIKLLKHIIITSSSKKDT